MVPDSAIVTTCAPSPNADARPSPIDAIVLHYTGMPSGEGALRWLCLPEAKVSAHYLVEEDGRVIQLVPEALRAWHAGVSAWAGRTRLNDVSVGIEIVNPGHEHGYRPFPAEQVAAVSALVLDIRARHGIARRRVLAHADIAPDRKEDPGELFPWLALSREGVCLACAPHGGGGLRAVRLGDQTSDSADLLADLSAFGYGVDSTGHFTPLALLCVVAFQRRFLPDRVDGIADGPTRATLKAALKLSRTDAA